MRARDERLAQARLAFSLLVAVPMACRGEPAPSVTPALTASAPSQAPTPSSTRSGGTPLASAGAVEPSGGAPPATAAAAPSAASPLVVDPAEEPPLLDANGKPLPQTDARPSVSSERFKRRMQRLADSIRTGEVEGARSTFFPLVAYAQVKDVEKPERDYRFRLMAHFERDVREYRKALGKDAERAEFLGVEVPEQRAQWMQPGKEGNRLGYFRVLRSQLRFRLPDGKERSFELTSMISWRGEWYVVHLHGFQ